MPSLQVRELPENIYRLLQDRAKVEHRSLAQQAVVALAKGLDTSLTRKQRREQLLHTISEKSCDTEQLQQLDPVDLIQNDRQR